MLQTIRDRVQGWIAGAIVVLLVLAFALWGVEYYIGSGRASNVVAKVNGQEITTDQLNTAFERLRQNLTLPNGSPLPLDQETQAKLKQQALQQLIMTRVLSDAAIKVGYRISPAQLNAVVLQIPSFQVNGQFSPQRFQQVLTALNYSPNQFFVDLTNTLLINQGQIGITNSAFGLPNEAQQAQKFLNQKRDIEVATIAAADFLNKVKVPETAIENYYQQHQDEFKTPDKVSLEYVELSADDIMKTVQISPQAVQQYYQDNIASYTKNGKSLSFDEVKTTIEKTLQQQKAQQIFSDQNDKLSDLAYTNPSTLAPVAAALGTKIQTTDAFTRQGGAGITANRQVVSTAFTDDVLKNGNNSNPIPINDGTVVVIRVKNYQPTTLLSLSQVRNKIEQQLQQQAAQVAAQQYGQKAVAAWLQNQNLQTFSQQYHLTWQTKTDVTRQTPGINAQMLRAAFSLPKPQNGKPNMVGTILPNGDYALIAVKAVNDATATLSDQQLHVALGEIANNYGQLEYQLYIDDLMKQAKIKKS